MGEGKLMQRTECAGCGGTRLERFLDLGKTPLANTFPARHSDPEIWHGLGLCRCRNCALVQNTELVPDSEIYNDDYGFYSGGSSAQLAYHKRAAELLIARHGGKALAAHGMLEIACNDGSLLSHFANAGYSALGIDPAKPADVAIDLGLSVRKEAFTADLAHEIVSAEGQKQLVVAYNSMAHIDDIGDVLQGISTLLRLTGVAVVEVQYLADLLTGNMIGQVYHEHRYFWSLTSFRHIAHLHGLNVVDAELIELQGGGIRFTLTRDFTQRMTPRAEAILDSEVWLRRPGGYDSMQGRIDRIREHTIALIQNERAAGRAVVGYAAAAKACTIMNYFQLELPYVIDTTTYKHGRYVPGVKVPIIAPEWERESQQSTRVLFAGNYLAHLLRSDTAYLQNGGRWLVVEPSPMVI
jgi:SAM-dependent methyltransferase